MLYLQKKKGFLRWETVKGQDEDTQFLREEVGQETCPPSPQQCPDTLKSHTLLATGDPETLSGATQGRASATRWRGGGPGAAWVPAL